MKKITIFSLALFISVVALAGPPFDTDDPVPVELKSWELYLSSHSRFGEKFGEGTLPHFEVNYGAFKNAQLHLIVPVAFNAFEGKIENYGIGDVEVGMKYRFIEETKYCPQIGVFPLCEIPTGNADKGLGNGKAQILLPIWLQKSFGEKWQTYGGYGCWINLADRNRNWSFVGLQVQYKLSDKFSLGAEVFDEIPALSFESEIKFNIGSIIDLNEKNHIILSAGSGISNFDAIQCYLGYVFSISKTESTDVNQVNLHQK